MMPCSAVELGRLLSKALEAVRATKCDDHVMLNADASMRGRPYLLLRVGEIDRPASWKRYVRQ